MAKRIELVHAEVVPKYGSNEVLTEFNTDKGATIFTFQVKTKVNDKADKSPVIFDNCTVFTDKEERKMNLRSTIVAGAILDIKGFQDRQKGSKPDKDGKAVYFDKINVKEIVAITSTDTPEVASSKNDDDDLPF